MSPASQADSLHVDRYIGGYLISNNVRQEQRHHNNNNFNKPSAKKNNKHVQYLPSANLYQNGFISANGLFPPANFCSNQNNWAGVPLISTVNARRNRKPHPNYLVPNAHSLPFNRQPIQLLNGTCNVEYAEGHLPLSRLALHTQGAPLILSRRYNGNNSNVRKQNQCQSGSYRQSASANDVRSADFALRKYHETLAPKDGGVVGLECKKEQNGVAVSSSNQNINQVLNLDSLSVTSDESSGSTNSETCLPRIIKPRKRRKKDRKLPSVGAEKLQVGDDGKSSESVNDAIPFTVTCYGGGGTDVNRNNVNIFNYKPTAEEPTSNHHHQQQQQQQRRDSGTTLTEAKQSTCSTEKILQPKQNSIKTRHTSDDVEDDSDDSSSLFEAISRCSPTMCQCKYCDPSGHQTSDYDRSSYSSLFSISELNFPTAADRSTALLIDKDSVLRRSWSEPCPGYSVESLRLSDGDKQLSAHHSDSNEQEDVEASASNSSFGAIGTGRRSSKSQDTSGLPEWKATVTPPSPEHVPDILFKCFPSRGVSLHVSPAIVTPGGHRDIEIKFYSVTSEDESRSKDAYQHDSKEPQPVAVQ